MATGPVLGAIPFMLIPTNTQSEVHPIADGLRVRTAPGQRSATVELRVGEGLLGTSIGERWKALPEVRAEWVLEPGARRYIAINPRGLDAALRAHGIAMARPLQDGDDDDDDDDRRNRGRKRRRDWRDNPPPPGDGTSPPPMGHNNPPEPLEPEPPLNPAPLAAPIVKESEQDKSSEGRSIDNARRREIRETAEYIGAGHAREEHLELRREYPGMTPLEFVNLIEQVMLHPTHWRDFPESGRTAYWDSKSKLLVIRDLTKPDRGTAFKHPNGPAYIEAMEDR